MASPETFDISRLLEPINAANPVGVDLREDFSPTALYFRVKDARTQARDAERNLLMNGADAGDAPDWRSLLGAVPQVLKDQSKDLELAAYFVEALVREKGFPGLRDGFELLRRLVETFGDQLYPRPDEDGPETQVAALVGLNGADADGTLIQPIANIPLTDHTSVGVFASSDYHQALEMERLDPPSKQKRIERGAVSLDKFQQAVNETSPEFFARQLEDIDAAGAAFAALTAALDAKFGDHSPPSSNIRRVLATCADDLRTFAKNRLPIPAPAAEPEPAAHENNGQAAPTAGAPAAPRPDVIETREDAFRAILKAADYFRRAEPHSPVPYALDRVVRWGRLPLPQLMQELIGDQSSIAQMFHLVGIENPGGQ